jgi:hypothetical protein
MDLMVPSRIKLEHGHDIEQRGAVSRGS